MRRESPGSHQSGAGTVTIGGMESWMIDCLRGLTEINGNFLKSSLVNRCQSCLYPTKTTVFFLSCFIMFYPFDWYIQIDGWHKSNDGVWVALCFIQLSGGFYENDDTDWNHESDVASTVLVDSFTNSGLGSFMKFQSWFVVSIARDLECLTPLLASVETEQTGRRPLCRNIFRSRNQLRLESSRHFIQSSVEWVESKLVCSMVLEYWPTFAPFLWPSFVGSHIPAPWFASDQNPPSKPSEKWHTYCQVIQVCKIHYSFFT